MVSAISRILVCKVFSSVFVVFSFSFSLFIFRRKGSIFFSRVFVWLMDFDRELRFVCRFFVLICNILRRFLRAFSLFIFSLKFRRVSFLAIAFGLLRSRLGSSMFILCLSN